MDFLEEFVYYKHCKGDHVLPHSHDMYEVILYRVGEGAVILDTEEVSYSNNTVFIIPRKMKHFEYTVTETSVLGCVFDTDYISLQTPVVVKGEQCEKTIERLYLELEKLKQKFLNNELVVGAPETNKLIAPITYIVYHLILLMQENEFEQKDIINNAKRYLRLNYKSKISYEFLAESAGYSYDRFRHLFADVVGMSMKQYQIGVRMSSAKVKLQDTDVSVQEIAKACGYKTTERFINAFKQNTGVSPLCYRKMSKNNPVNRVFNIQS